MKRIIGLVVFIMLFSATAAFGQMTVVESYATTNWVNSNYLCFCGGTVTGPVTFTGAVNNLSLFQTSSGDNQNFGGSLPPATTSDDNTDVGNSSLSHISTGSSNTAVGYSTLYADTTGQQNAAFGVSALSALTTASDNTGLGTETLLNLTTGSGNTAVGQSAGTGSSPVLQTISFSTFIGYEANSSVDGITNSTAIGNEAQVSASNQFVLGNGSITSTVFNGGLHWSTGTLGPTTAPTIACNAGDLYSNKTGTVGYLLFVCSATNTWTDIK